jgi:replicative DNA helicase
MKDAKYDVAQEAVLGWLLSGLGKEGETTRDAKTVQEAGGLLLFDDERYCELWRRVEDAINEGLPPHVYKRVKQVEDLPAAFVEQVIENACPGSALEVTYLPELIEASRARRLDRAMKDGNLELVQEILKRPMSNKQKTASQLCAAATEVWQEAAERPGELSGISSGLIDVDRLTWGWQPQQFIVIGARPSRGKTAMLVGFARHAAIACAIPTVIFTLESSAQELSRRILCQLTGADQSRLRGGMASERELASLPGAMTRYGKSPLHIVECQGASIGWIQNEARKLRETMGIKLVCVDYLQKITAPMRNEKKTYEVAQVSGGLKALAVELNVPVISAAQLSREPEKAKDRFPQLSDLADCGQIERDADIVGMIHRKDQENWLVFNKVRDGATDTVKLSFLPHCARFDNLCPIDTADYKQPHND